MSNTPPILRVQNLSIQRDGILILDRLEWTVNRGEHWILMGSNGSGKTSLLSALTGYFSPTEGDIDLLGERFGESDWRELRTAIGIVSSGLRQMMADSEPALYSVVSGKYAIIDYWGQPKRKDLLEARRLLKLVEADYLADRPWAVLSQGERQRVLIARALMSNPKLLILDEPCAGLDPVARETFLQFLEKLGRSRHSPALILVTHHVEEIMPVFSHILFLKAGKVITQGTVRTSLNSRNLSSTFGASVSLRRKGTRYLLEAGTSGTRRNLCC
ncbi:MAG: transporter [Verrucomicrobiales bacterium]|nr:transporter [Verrucomicrobiales bacterium]